MNIKMIFGFLILWSLATVVGFAEKQPSVNDIITKMQSDLDLHQDQVTNITPVIEQYSLAFQDLQKSIDDGTINQSAIDNQWQQIEEEETQALSQYLKPFQLSEWRNLQSQLYQRQNNPNSDNSTASDEYSNLPRNSGGN